MVVVTDTKIEDCNPKNDDQYQDIFDMSNLKLVPINDTDTFADGSFKFLKNVKNPLILEAQFKRYFRSSWVLEFKKTFFDICPDLHNPLSPAYYFTKSYPPCPVKAGSLAIYNMTSTQPPEWFMMTIPGFYAGRYKAQWYFSTNDDEGQTIKQCLQFYGDLYEMI